MEDAIRILSVDAMDMLSLSVLVLFLGMYLNRRIRVLEDNYIPPAVTGGLLFSLATWLVYAQAGVEIDFDMRFRDLLLLVFFSTIGLSARLGQLVSGGRDLALLTLAAAVFLFLQNGVGVGLAMLLDVHPTYGLLAGSVSFAGGHGTAIAWGTYAQEAGLPGAIDVALAFATFGLVAGGLVGGPIARRLMKADGLEGSSERRGALPTDASDAGGELLEESEWIYRTLSTLLVLAICVSLGDAVNRFLADLDVRLPGFLTSMFVGIVITNLAEPLRLPLARSTIAGFGEISLHVFLAMSMMTIELWALAGSASGIALVLVSQILLMTIFAIYVVHRLMGRDYDAVVMASGFAGLGLGATPVAIANMDAVTTQFGPSTRAFLVLPLVGAFFIDLLNAGTIKFFIQMIDRYLS